MGVEIAAWRGGRNLVTTCEGMPRLWLNSAGDVCDMLGQQVTTEEDEVQEVDDLLLFVAEWLFCIAQSDAPSGYSRFALRLHSVGDRIVGRGRSVLHPLVMHRGAK